MGQTRKILGRPNVSGIRFLTRTFNDGNEKKSSKKENGPG